MAEQFTASIKGLDFSEEKERFLTLSSDESRKFWLSFYEDLDVMDEQWSKILHEAKLRSEGASFAEDPFWEQLCIYFMFRHLTAASEDFNLYGKVQFCVLSCLIIGWILDIYPEKEQDKNGLKPQNSIQKKLNILRKICRQCGKNCCLILKKIW